jgi:hypothetical protein
VITEVLKFIDSIVCYMCYSEVCLASPQHPLSSSIIGGAVTAWLAWNYEATDHELTPPSLVWYVHPSLINHPSSINSKLLPLWHLLPDSDSSSTCLNYRWLNVKRPFSLLEQVATPARVIIPSVVGLLLGPASFALAMQPSHTLAKSESLRRLKRQGLKLFAWVKTLPGTPSKLWKG